MGRFWMRASRFRLFCQLFQVTNPEREREREREKERKGKGTRGKKGIYYISAVSKDPYSSSQTAAPPSRSSWLPPSSRLEGKKREARKLPLLASRLLLTGTGMDSRLAKMR
jgi:hypothetical protein